MWACLALVASTGCRDYLEGGDPRYGGYDGDFEVNGRLVVPEDVESVPSGDVEVALVRVDITDEGMPVIGDVYQRDQVGPIGPGDELDFELMLRRDPEDTEFYAPDDEAGEYRVAPYMLGAFVDVDADGEIGAGDDLVGGSMTLLVAAKGERPASSELGQLPLGWATVPYMGDGEIYAFTDSEHYDDAVLSANLLPRRVGEVRGTIAPALGSPVRVDLFSVPGQYTGVQPPNATVATVTTDATSSGATFRFDSVPTPPPARTATACSTPPTPAATGTGARA
jgi:hypothetical protein